MIEPLLRTRELADLIGFSQSTIQHWAEKGEIPCFRLGGRLRFRESEVLAWLEERRVEGAGGGRRRTTDPYQPPSPGRIVAGTTDPSQEEEQLMPARQRGSVVPRGKTWAARWYDHNNTRRSRGGFRTKTDARTWVDNTVDGVEALRRGDTLAPGQAPTVTELVNTFLATHEVDPATTDKMRWELKHATTAFGDRTPDTLTPLELDRWRGTLPPRSRQQLFGAFRQVLRQAVALRVIDRDPTERIRNRRVRLDENREIKPFTGWEQVEAVADEIHPRYSALVLCLVGTGMRPEEVLALEWRDIDRGEQVARVERVHSQGRTKACKKSDRQRRRVPLRARVLDALDQHPRRIDSRLVFPGHDGEHLKLKTFSLRHWKPALFAAGVEHRGVYACRHSFASWAIAAGFPLFYLSRIMGTSVAQIDATYGHLVPDSEDYLRGLLDTWDNATIGVSAGGLGT